MEGSRIHRRTDPVPLSLEYLRTNTRNGKVLIMVHGEEEETGPVKMKMKALGLPFVAIRDLNSWLQTNLSSFTSRLKFLVTGNSTRSKVMDIYRSNSKSNMAVFSVGVLQTILSTPHGERVDWNRLPVLSLVFNCYKFDIIGCVGKKRVRNRLLALNAYFVESPAQGPADYVVILEREGESQSENAVETTELLLDLATKGSLGGHDIYSSLRIPIPLGSAFLERLLLPDFFGGIYNSELLGLRAGKLEGLEFLLPYKKRYTTQLCNCISSAGGRLIDEPKPGCVVLIDASLESSEHLLLDLLGKSRQEPQVIYLNVNWIQAVSAGINTTTGTTTTTLSSWKEFEFTGAVPFPKVHTLSNLQGLRICLSDAITSEKDRSRATDLIGKLSGIQVEEEPIADLLILPHFKTWKLGKDKSSLDVKQNVQNVTLSCIEDMERFKSPHDCHWFHQCTTVSRSENWTPPFKGRIFKSASTCKAHNLRMQELVWQLGGKSESIHTTTTLDNRILITYESTPVWDNAFRQMRKSNSNFIIVSHAYVLAQAESSELVDINKYVVTISPKKTEEIDSACGESGNGGVATTAETMAAKETLPRSSPLASSTSLSESSTHSMNPTKTIVTDLASKSISCANKSSENAQTIKPLVDRNTIISPSGTENGDDDQKLDGKKTSVTSNTPSYSSRDRLDTPVKNLFTQSRPVKGASMVFAEGESESKTRIEVGPTQSTASSTSASFDSSCSSRGVSSSSSTSENNPSKSPLICYLKGVKRKAENEYCKQDEHALPHKLPAVTSTSPFANAVVMDMAAAAFVKQGERPDAERFHYDVAVFPNTVKQMTNTTEGSIQTRLPPLPVEATIAAPAKTATLISTRTTDSKGYSSSLTGPPQPCPASKTPVLATTLPQVEHEIQGFIGSTCVGPTFESFKHRFINHVTEKLMNASIFRDRIIFDIAYVATKGTTRRVIVSSSVPEIPPSTLKMNCGILATPPFTFVNPAKCVLIGGYYMTGPDPVAINSKAREILYHMRQLLISAFGLKTLSHVPFDGNEGSLECQSSKEKQFIVRLTRSSTTSGANRDKEQLTFLRFWLLHSIFDMIPQRLLYLSVLANVHVIVICDKVCICGNYKMEIMSKLFPTCLKVFGFHRIHMADTSQFKSKEAILLVTLDDEKLVNCTCEIRPSGRREAYILSKQSFKQIINANDVSILQRAQHP